MSGARLPFVEEAHPAVRHAAAKSRSRAGVQMVAQKPPKHHHHHRRRRQVHNHHNHHNHHNRRLSLDYPHCLRDHSDTEKTQRPIPSDRNRQCDDAWSQRRNKHHKCYNCVQSVQKHHGRHCRCGRQIRHGHKKGCERITDIPQIPRHLHRRVGHRRQVRQGHRQGYGVENIILTLNNKHWL